MVCVSSRFCSTGECATPVDSGSEESRRKETQRSPEGRSPHGRWRFTRALFNQIGGKEAPRYAALTWKERDAIHKGEFPGVKARYQRHMSTVK